MNDPNATYDNASYPNPAFVHRIEMNDSDDEIDLDAIQERAIENPTYEMTGGLNMAHPVIKMMSPIPAKTKRDPCVIMMAGVAILLAVIACVIAMGSSLSASTATLNSDCCSGSSASPAASSAADPPAVSNCPPRMREVK